jgi:hypothetical protein
MLVVAVMANSVLYVVGDFRRPGDYRENRRLPQYVLALSKKADIT